MPRGIQRRLTPRYYLERCEVDAVRHVHVAEVTTTAAEPRVVADVGMVERRAGHAAWLRQTLLVVRIVPAPCTVTHQ